MVYGHHTQYIQIYDVLYIPKVCVTCTYLIGMNFLIQIFNQKFSSAPGCICSLHPT
jgi:hypothetical protein